MTTPTEAEGTAREPMGLEEAKAVIEDALSYSVYRTGIDPNGLERRRARLGAALAAYVAAAIQKDREAQTAMLQDAIVGQPGSAVTVRYTARSKNLNLGKRPDLIILQEEERNDD